MDSEQLGSLTPQDWQLLTEGCRQATYRRGEVILAEGTPGRALFILRAGLARVEVARSGQGIAINQLEPGEVFGEMSLLEETVASASVIAQDEVRVDIVEHARLQALLSSEPGFAVRFYYSLAINLSRRLRRVTAQPDAHDGAGPRGARRPRIGNISARQIPQELRDVVDSFEATMVRVDQGLRGGALADTAAQTEVGESCDALVAALRDDTDGDALVEIGWDDLLAFRDTPQLAAGLGDYVFRKTFARFMLSATIAHCYDRPRGIVDDFAAAELILANDADGDDRLGVHIDRWFLVRPFCRGRRAARRAIADLIADRAGGRPAHDPLPVTSLGSGVPRELLDLCQGRPGAAFHATCLDFDQAALARARDSADGAGCRERLNLVLGDAIAIARGQDRLALPPQRLIYAVGLCDTLADDDVVALLNWGHDHLAAGGELLISALTPAHPDGAFVEHILNWPLVYRTADEVAALFGRSRFGGPPAFAPVDDDDYLFFAIGVKSARA